MATNIEEIARSIKGPRMSRRTMLMRSAMLAALMGAGGALGSLPAAARGSGRRLAQQQPLTVVSWTYHPEIVQENLKLFAEAYGEPPINYEQVPSGSAYLDVLTAKFIGGQVMDFVYVDEFYANRLYKAGYLRDLDEFPEIPEIKQGIFPVGLNAFTSSEGKMLGLPYWAGPQQLVVHQGHLDQAGLKPPDTWEEFVDQLRQIKGKGIAEYPFLPQWVKSSSQLDWTLLAECYSEGDYLFDEKYNPTFKDGGIALQKTLERWQLLWNEKLVPPDVLTVPNEGIQAYATGQYTYHWTHEYDQRVFNDPAQSKLAGMCKNIVHPGKVKTTFVDCAMYSMPAKNHDPQRAWPLLRWFGWKDPKNGQFNVGKKWALIAGLGTVIKEVANDPEVVADWKKWKDVDLYNQQMERGRGRVEMKQLWYAEFAEYLMATVQDCIVGKMTVGDTIKALYDKVMTLKSAYPEV